MSFGKKVVSGLLWGQIGMSGRTLICFAISILVARSLGVRDYGVYAALISAVDLLIRFTDMGVQAIFSSYIPRYRSREQFGECSYVVRRVLLLRTALLLATAAAVHLFANPIAAFVGEPAIHGYLTLTALLFFVLGSMNSFIFIVIANMEMKYYAAVELFVSFVQLLGVVYLMKIGISVSRVATLVIVVHALQLAAYAYGSWATIKPPPVAIDLLPVTKFGLVTWLSTMLQYFRFKSVDVFMILYFLKDTSSVAYYDIAYLIVITGGYVLLNSLDRLILPIYSEAHARDGLAGLRDVWSAMTKFSVYVSAPIMVFLIAHADSLVLAFYSDHYLPSAALIKVFAAIMLAGFLLGSETAITVVFPLNKERLFLYTRGFNGIVNLLFNFLLIPRYGVMGAVISTSGTRLLTTIVELAIAIRLTGVRLPYHFIAKVLLFSGIAISWTLFFERPNIAQMIVMGAIVGLIVTGLTLRFCRFSDGEKKLIHDFHPQIHGWLTRYELLR